MEKETLSILTLFALYILYSECIKLPPIIKKNKTLAYLVVGVSYLCFYNNIEGVDDSNKVQRTDKHASCHRLTGFEGKNFAEKGVLFLVYVISLFFYIACLVAITSEEADGGLKFVCLIILCASGYAIYKWCYA